jgi:hypothetical protein
MELNNFVEVGDMLCDCERLVAARSLKWLKYAV